SRSDVKPAATAESLSWPCRLVALFLVGGGLFGILANIWKSSGVHKGQTVTLTVQVPVGLLLVAALPFVGGALMLARRHAGLIISIIALMLQAVSFQFDRFVYQFVTVASGWVGFQHWT